MLKQAGAELCQAQNSSSLIYEFYKLKLGGAIQKSTILVAGRVGEIDNKAISASNLKLKLKLTEAELGNIIAIGVTLLSILGI